MALIVPAKLTRMLLNGIVDFPVPQNWLFIAKYYFRKFMRASGKTSNFFLSAYPFAACATLPTSPLNCSLTPHLSRSIVKKKGFAL